MKSAKEIISEIIKKIQTKHKPLSYEFSDSSDSSLTPFDLIPIHFTGMIEDYLFRQSAEIFDILKEDTDQDIEGLTYTEIQNDTIKNAYFDKVRQNIPKYYALKLSERQKHFELEGQLYMKKLGIKPDQMSQTKKEEISNKKPAKVFEPTPMKCTVSKKQGLQRKKQQKKNISNVNQKAQPKNDQPKEGILQKQQNQQRFQTPEKKQKEKKKVKFFEFEYVKDFSQYKTPKILANVEQLIEPLKDSQPQQKSKE